MYSYVVTLMIVLFVLSWLLKLLCGWRFATVLSWNLMGYAIIAEAYCVVNVLKAPGPTLRSGAELGLMIATAMNIPLFWGGLCLRRWAKRNPPA